MPTKKPVRRTQNEMDPLQTETDAIWALDAREEDAQWQIGTHYNNIVEKKLWRGAGYATVRAYAESQLPKISFSTLRRWGLVAKNFPESAASTYGTANLALLLAYLGVKKMPMPEGDPGQVPIELVGAEGATRHKPFGECSSRDLAGALHHAKTGSSPSDHRSIPAEDAKKILLLRTEMDNVLGDHTPASLYGEQIGGQTLVSMVHVPLDEFWMACQALGYPDQHPEDDGQSNRAAQQRSFPKGHPRRRAQR